MGITHKHIVRCSLSTIHLDLAGSILDWLPPPDNIVPARLSSLAMLARFLLLLLLLMAKLLLLLLILMLLLILLLLCFPL